MFTNKNVEVITEVDESLKAKRLRRYKEKITKIPKICNQIFVYPQNTVVKLGGNPYQCDKVEGYIKFPEKDYFEEITLLDKPFIIAMLSDFKLIVQYGDKVFFRGYKKENQEGFKAIMKITLEESNTTVFLVDVGKTEIEPYFILADMDECSGIETSILYESFISIIKDAYKFDIVDVEEEDEEEDDE